MRYDVWVNEFLNLLIMAFLFLRINNFRAYLRVKKIIIIPFYLNFKIIILQAILVIHHYSYIKIIIFLINGNLFFD